MDAGEFTKQQNVIGLLNLGYLRHLFHPYA